MTNSIASCQHGILSRGFRGCCTTQIAKWNPGDVEGYKRFLATTKAIFQRLSLSPDRAGDRRDLGLMALAWALAPGFVSPRRHAAYALVSGPVFTAWDLYLDPQWVARGLWIWETPGPYYGIPLENFAGWVAAAAAITYLVRPIDLQRALRPLAILYTIVAIT